MGRYMHSPVPKETFTKNAPEVNLPTEHCFFGASPNMYAKFTKVYETLKPAVRHLHPCFDKDGKLQE
jgi:hypothetical protein